MTPPKLPLAGGAAVCVLTLLVFGIKAINKSRENFLDDLTRDTSKSFDEMRMEANTKTMETLSNEIRAHETALKELHESRHKDSFVPTESSERHS